MPYNPDIHHRRSIRLKGYDYSQEGLYFVTLCVACRGDSCSRPNLFGKITDGEMMLNDFGQVAHDEWVKLSERYPNAYFDVFQIMPNHIHGIIELHPVGATLAVARNNTTNYAQNGTVGDSENCVTSNWATARVAPTDATNDAHVTMTATIGDIVGSYKSLVVNKCLEICKLRNEFLGKLWQRNYFEHIIRNEKSYQFIADYIINNPAKWESDKFYSE